VAFVLTALAYVVTDESLVRTRPGGTSARSPMAEFLDQRGGTLLLVEAAVLGAVSFAAIALDGWRTPRPAHTTDTERCTPHVQERR
jgi:hypothetical protein